LDDFKNWETIALMQDLLFLIASVYRQSFFTGYWISGLEGAWITEVILLSSSGFYDLVACFLTETFFLGFSCFLGEGFLAGARLVGFLELIKF
jgi:hypothetical protein